MLFMSVPKGLLRGYVKMINILLSITGPYFKPIHPAYFLNEDRRSQYYCSRHIPGDKSNNEWSRVTIPTLISKNRDYM